MSILWNVKESEKEAEEEKEGEEEEEKIFFLSSFSALSSSLTLY